MDLNILLCDIGGTHARFARYARKGAYLDFKKYRLNDFESFEDIVQKYHDDSGLKYNEARFSTARTPMNGVIEYVRHAGDPSYVINFNNIEKQFGWDKALYLNDLEAAAYGVPCLTDDETQIVTPAEGEKWNDHKIVISVGTGVGHAGIMDGHIMRTNGGHWLPVTVTEEHRALEKFVRAQKDTSYALIMEDFVSGRGLKAITQFISGIENNNLSPNDFMAHLKEYPDAIRLFFEFLGLYVHQIVSVTGFYGGVYVTGGVIDHLVKNNIVDWRSFETYFRPKMVQIVDDALISTPIYYIKNDELPLLGLTAIEIA
jgi:glucokinase